MECNGTAGEQRQEKGVQCQGWEESKEAVDSARLE